MILKFSKLSVYRTILFAHERSQIAKVQKLRCYEIILVSSLNIPKMNDKCHGESKLLQRMGVGDESRVFG